jgi:sensor histidine kinase YesM
MKSWMATLSVNEVRARSVVQEVVMFAFCLGSYFVLLTIFASSSEWLLIDHIYTSFFLGTLLIPTAINDLWLRRKFLNQRRYVVYTFMLIITILFGTWFNQYFFNDLVDIILPNHYFISFYDYGDLFKFFVAFVSIALLINLSIEWFQLKEDQTRMLALEKEKVNAELKALMNQINPHFLFNSLTVLYSLALHNARETSEAILKLSDILRYVIYQSREKLVTLGSEVTLIENYIALQRYRVPASATIEFVTKIENDDAAIPPMLLLPLVENSFKHGIQGDVANHFVRILLEAKGGTIVFSIENNNGSANELEQTPGIGLKNIRDRLSLIFPGKSELLVDRSPSTFRVDLRISQG